MKASKFQGRVQTASVFILPFFSTFLPFLAMSPAMLERGKLRCLEDVAVEVTMSQHKGHHGALASQTMPETQLKLATWVANFGKFWLQLMPPRRR